MKRAIYVGVVALVGLGAALVPGTAALASGGATYFAAPTATGTGDCLSPANACSLSAAVSATGDQDFVVLADGTYANTHVVISDDISLSEANGAEPALDGGGTGDVVSVGSDADVAMTGINIQNSGNGNAGIDNSGTLALSTAQVTGNGTGVLSSGSLEVDNSLIDSNNGDGIHSTGPDFTFDEGTVNNNGDDGIRIDSSSAGPHIDVSDADVFTNGHNGIELTATRATVHEVALESNLLSGIVVVGQEAVVKDVFVEDNDANGIVLGSGATAEDATVTGSSDAGVTTIPGSTTEGLFASTIAYNNVGVDTNGSVLELGADIVAVSNTDCTITNTGIPQDIGYNIDSDGSCGLNSVGSISDSSAVKADLGPPQANGGRLMTIAPTPGSPAIGLVTGELGTGFYVCGTADARGLPRPPAPCDAGAVETAPTKQAPDVELALTPGGGVTAGQPVTLTASISGTEGPATGTVRFTADGNTLNGCAAVGVDASGSASCTTSALAVGTYDLRAHYSGNVDYTTGSDQISPYNVSKVVNPTITASESSTSTKTVFGWYRTPVVVTFSCEEGSSSLANGCPSPVTVSTNGAAQVVTKTIDGTDGGSASATDLVSVDTVAPTVTVSGVTNGKTYKTAPKLKCVAKDGLSGVVSCKLTSTSRKIGTKTKVTVTAVATDKAGNKRTAHAGYDLAKGTKV